MPVRRTRLAPSPTGFLHLGNARTFAFTWALARNEGWEVVLRVEDLDCERVKAGAVDDAIASLAWLGLDWDGAITVQSADRAPYRAALERLAARGRVFRCDRSRADVRRAASAPHAEDAETRYEPSLRPDASAFIFADERANHRLLVDPAREPVLDELRGACEFDPGSEVGDFLVWTKLAVPSYQLAVVVDDIRQGITDVVRGDDLLASAARQQIIYRLLDAAPPRWWHLPLVLASDGRRLAKRNDDTSLAQLRAAGVRGERILGLIAAMSHVIEERRELAGKDFRTLVTADTLRALALRERASHARVTEEDLQWLYDRSA